jgi:predicted nuclease with TOPRIM domain
MLHQLATGRIPDGMSLLDMMPASVKKNLDADTKKQIAAIRSVDDINSNISEMDAVKEEMRASKEEMKASIQEMEASRTEMTAAMEEMRASESNLGDLSAKMVALREAVPGAFEEAEDNYMLSIEEKRDGIETVFQNTINEGFKDIYMLVAIAAAVAILLLLGYSTRKEKQRMESHS